MEPLTETELQDMEPLTEAELQGQCLLLPLDRGPPEVELPDTTHPDTTAADHPGIEPRDKTPMLRGKT